MSAITYNQPASQMTIDTLAASLLGLTVLSIPSQPGVTWVHAVALEP